VGAVDVLVAEECSEGEAGDALGFWCCCPGVGGVVAAAAAVAVTVPL